MAVVTRLVELGVCSDHGVEVPVAADDHLEIHRQQRIHERPFVVRRREPEGLSEGHEEEGRVPAVLSPRRERVRRNTEPKVDVAGAHFGEGGTTRRAGQATRRERVGVPHHRHRRPFHFHPRRQNAPASFWTKAQCLTASELHWLEVSVLERADFVLTVGRARDEVVALGDTCVGGGNKKTLKPSHLQLEKAVFGRVSRADLETAEVVVFHDEVCIFARPAGIDLHLERVVRGGNCELRGKGVLAGGRLHGLARQIPVATQGWCVQNLFQWRSGKCSCV
mmetsp:Transcript_65657/g.155112  ORF Transcript_65657/g.155112 Transcript_65657/m.155112 type:complete len:279 (+) Transcript_65657:296-1132(+)